jgi:hypothetical protein
MTLVLDYRFIKKAVDQNYENSYDYETESIKDVKINENESKDESGQDEDTVDVENSQLYNGDFFYVILENNELKIYSEDKTDLLFSQKINEDMLSTNDKEIFESGIYLDDFEQLFNLLESYSS